MIYFRTTDQKYVLILEPKQVQDLAKGVPVVSDDKMVLIAFSPDIEWTFGEMQKILGEGGRVMLPHELDKILKESMSREMVIRP